VVAILLKSQEIFTFADALKKRLFKERANYPQASMDENIEGGNM
jgi:hypothetical protein